MSVTPSQHAAHASGIRKILQAFGIGRPKSNITVKDGPTPASIRTTPKPQPSAVGFKSSLPANQHTFGAPGQS